MLVREVMTHRVVSVHPETSVKRAVQLLDEHQITAMPVVDGSGHLVGVVSEADVLRDVVLPDRRTAGHSLDVTAAPAILHVAEVMTTLPMTVGPEDDVADAVTLLVDTQVKSLPVVAYGRLVGMVSRRDVIAVLARHDDLIEAEVDEALRMAGVECTVDVGDGIVGLRDAASPECLRIARVIAARVPGVIGISTE